MTLPMFPSINEKYSNYAGSATFRKSAKIMLVFPNYAKTYVSTIDEGPYLYEKWSGVNNVKHVYKLCLWDIIII